MTALPLPRLRLDHAAILRAITAGSVWGIAVSTALLGLSFYQCGTICLGQVVDTAALSVLAGIFAVGPAAMIRREAQASAQ